MSTIPRLYIDPPLAEGALAALTAEQAHYLKNVLRRAPGDAVRVFNGHSGEFAATIGELGKKGGAVALGAQLRRPEAGTGVWLLVAPVKRGPLEAIVQKATELGVGRILPALTERSNAQKVNEQRLGAIALEAAEQCGRLTIPSVEPARQLPTLLERWPQERRLVFCDEGGDDPGAEWGGPSGRALPLLEALAGGAAGPWAILIGPEGGFSPSERALLRALPFVSPVTLGPRILRADTAAIAALALWQAALGDLKRT